MCVKLIVLLFMLLWYFNCAVFCQSLVKPDFNDILLV
jgi:hypothetical protein